MGADTPGRGRGPGAVAVGVQAPDQQAALCLRGAQVGGCVFQLGGRDVEGAGPFPRVQCAVEPSALLRARSYEKQGGEAAAPGVLSEPLHTVHSLGKIALQSSAGSLLEAQG